MTLGNKDFAKGAIVVQVPATQPLGTVTATLTVGGQEAPFFLSVGGIDIQILTTSVVARRGQTVMMPVRVTLPPDFPATDLTFDLIADGCHIDPRTLHVPTGGSAEINLELVTDLDAQPGVLSDQVLTVSGFQGTGLQNPMFDITIADPIEVKALLKSPKEVKVPRGGSFVCSLEFSTAPGFETEVSISGAMPPGVEPRAPRSATIRDKSVVPVDFDVPDNANPLDNARGTLNWQTIDGTNRGTAELFFTIDDAPVRRTLGIDLRLVEIHCVDEGDGPGTAEPYLWTIFFKVDGETCSFATDRRPFNLDGSATMQRTIAEHGNLGSRDVDAGQTISVPGHVGFWRTSLVPIPVSNADIRERLKAQRGQENLAGEIGVVVVLLEEDSLPNGAEVAGYNAMLRTLELKLNAALLELGVNQEQIDPSFEESAKAAIKEAATAAIKDVLSFPEKIAAWITGPDQILGASSFRFKHDDLAIRKTIPFEARWKEGVNVNVDESLLLGHLGELITSGGEWILKGSITAS